MIARTEAIVLKSMKYRDTSKIVTLYTLSFGKVSVIAKGARDIKSKFGASLEPMTHISAVFYKKPHRELHLLSDADILEEFRSLHSEYELMNAGFSVIALLNAVMHGEEEHPEIFRLVKRTLRALDTGTKNILSVLYCYEIQLAGLLGFAMSFDVCGICGTAVDAGGTGCYGFNPMMGTILDERCGGGEERWIPLSLQSARILQHLARVDPDAAAGVGIPDATRMEIGRVLRSHFGSHVEATRRMKGFDAFGAGGTSGPRKN
jgi:DNA repair protein RecO (recombination protein O)